ncbi:MAG: hypothetical protein AB7E48_02330 [Deferribacterales bacterium]
MVQKDEIISSINSGTFLNLLYGIAHDDELTMSLLIEMHNADEINIVKECMQACRDAVDYDFFVLRFKFEKLLPSLNASVEEVMNCIHNLIAQAGDDLASHEPVPAFKSFCKQQEGRIDEALNIAVKEYSKYHEFIFWLLSAGVEMDFDKYIIQLRELLLGSVIQHKISSVATIKQIDFSGKLNEAKELFFVLKSVLDTNDNNQLRSSSLDSLLNLYSLHLDIQNEILQSISHILQSTDELILHNAVCSYLRVEESANLELRSLFLRSFININPQNKGTIKVLDSALYRMLSSSVYIEGVEFIEKYLLKNESFDVMEFSSATHVIIRKPELLGHIVTRWFLSKKYILGRAVSQVFSRLSSEGISVAFDSNSTTHSHEISYIFLARKAVGWLFFYPMSMVSYLYSLLHYASDEERKQIAYLLLNKVLLNYPETGKNYLSSKIKDETDSNIKSLLNEILGKIDSYFIELQSTNQLKELHISEEWRIAFQRYHSGLTRDSMKEAEKRSIFRQIVTKQLILYGHKTVSYFGINDTEVKRSESELKPYEVSRSFPILAIIDPTGLEYELFILKWEECV